MIFLNCANCNSRISFWTWESERVSLKKKHGDSINLTCTKCDTSTKYEINDLKAKESKIAIIGIPIMIFGIINRNESNRVSNFNQS